MRPTASDAQRSPPDAWPAAAATAVLAVAWWLRSPGIVPLAATLVAACLAIVAVRWRRVARTRATVATVALGVVAASVVVGEWQRGAIASRPDAERAARDSAATALLGDAFAQWDQRLAFAAGAALDAPADPAGAFAALDLLADGEPEAGVVLFRDGRPVAWRGTIRVPLVGALDSAGTIVTPFYVAVYASAMRGGDRAIATMLVHAAPPATAFARPLDRLVARRAGVRGFVVAPPGAGNAPRYRIRGVPVLSAVPITFSEAAMVLETTAAARRAVGAALAVALAFLLLASWHPAASLGWRLAVLAVAALVAGLAPLSAYSTTTRWFDPAAYFARLGGPFTASLGALIASGVAVLLALLDLRRAAGGQWSRARGARSAAVIGVLVVAGAGPYLLRDLARGIEIPPGGPTLSLWIGWQLAIFLPAMGLLLLGSWAGTRAMGGRRGGPVWVAPGVAAVAALAAPLLWRAPFGWPDPYILPWVAAVGLLATARRSRWMYLAASVVASTGALTLVWGAVARGRVRLASEDVGALRRPDPDAAALLNRFIQSLAQDPPPPSREALLSRYAQADLVAAGYPVHLGMWLPDRGEPVATVAVSPFDEPVDGIATVVELARGQGRPVATLADMAPWHELMAAVPHPDGTVTSIIVGPRTRLLADVVWAPMLGLTRGAREAPYELSLAEGGPGGREVAVRWTRRGSAVHGDWEIDGPDGPLRVHATVDLRPLDALWQRGGLLVLLDVGLALAVWTGHALARRGFVRWGRGRRRRMRGSFRTQLTLALFGFALVPVVGFATFLLRRLGAEERRSRELVVQELLRNALSPGQDATLESRAFRADAPLLVYRDGELFAASEPLFSALAPAGRYLPPSVQRDLELDLALTATAQLPVGAVRAVMGYRGATPAPADGRLTVVASPARTDDADAGRQREDLAVLLVVAACAAALGAWGLSGAAARVLAAPLGTMRRAIARVAAGDAVALPPEAAPAEFAGVFEAFTRMASDLGESRAALAEAQRRTAAVLRQVASGVLAVDDAGAVTLANPRAEALLGRPLPPGTPMAHVADATLAGQVAAFLASDAAEDAFSLRAGDRVWQGSLARLRRGGAVLTLDDVTDLARAQRVLAWGEMARQVAHEIKNPLTPMRLGMQHLRRAHADGRADFGRILDENAGRILAEIDRLDEIARAFSRYGTPAHAVPPADAVDVTPIVRDVVALEVMGASGVAWRAEDDGGPCWALARDVELREVLLNLLENARQAAARHVAVRVTREGRDVVVRVRDDGRGIAEDVLPRVFDPHFSTTTSGSGLGLAISRRLVEGWGGRIALESTPGAGTTVTVVLVATVPPREIPA